MIEQDLRFIKWRVQNMLGFKSFESVSRTLTGIEIVRMIIKEQVTSSEVNYFYTFCSLASRTLTGIEILRMIKKEQITFPKVTYFKTFCSLAA